MSNSKVMLGDEILEASLLEAAYIGMDIFALNAYDFTNCDYRRVYDSMCEMHDSGHKVDRIAMYTKHQTDKWWRGDLMAFSNVPILGRPQQVEDSIRALKEYTKRRKLNDLADSIKAHLVDKTQAQEVASYIEESIRDISSSGDAEYSVLGLHDKGLEIFKNNYVPTGLPFIDNIIRGFGRGHLIVIGARTSVGKSALAEQIAMEIRKIGNVVFASYEMSATELELRALSSKTGVPTDQITANELGEKQKELLHEAQQALKKGYKFIVLDKNPAVHDLITVLRIINKKENPICYFIDYVQLVENNKGKHEKRHLEIAEITRKMKLFAEEVKKPVVILAQLNRGAEEDDVPKLSHFRESGSIEQDANMAIVIHRDKKDEHKIGILKNRNGRTGWVDVDFDKTRLTFKEKTL